MIRFGILGCGAHGERYLRHLKAGDVPGAVPVALWRRDRGAAQVLAARYGVQAHPAWRDLIEDPAVDAVIVATPPGLHPEPILAAARIGKPVLAEKPLAANLAQALALAAALPDDARVMVAHTLRFSPALITAHKRLPELGEVYRIRVAQRLEPSTIAWQRNAELAGGGSVTLTGVHGFDLVRWFTGATPTQVDARLRRLLGHPMENLFDACFEYADRPLLAACEVSKFSASRSALLELVGTQGQCWVDYLGGRVEWLSGRDRHTVAELGDRPTLPPTLSAFCRWLEGDGANPVPVAEGVEALRMADAVYRSAALGRPVPVTLD